MTDMTSRARSRRPYAVHRLIDCGRDVDRWSADAGLDAESVRGYADYIRRAASDPTWPNLSDADRKQNLAQAGEMDAFADRMAGFPQRKEAT